MQGREGWAEIEVARDGQWRVHEESFVVQDRVERDAAQVVACLGWISSGGEGGGRARGERMNRMGNTYSGEV